MPCAPSLVVRLVDLAVSAAFLKPLRAADGTIELPQWEAKLSNDKACTNLQCALIGKRIVELE